MTGNRNAPRASATPAHQEPPRRRDPAPHRVRESDMTTRADTGPGTGTGTARCRPAILGLLLATLAAAPAARADLATPLVSGLNWRSGASAGGFPCLDQLRDRPLDALTMFIAPPSFADMVRNTGTWLKGYRA